MYHAIVRVDGKWVSFGLHIPSPHWSNVFKTLQRAYKPENVSRIFWSPDDQVKDVLAAQFRMMLNVGTANLLQNDWNEGGNRHLSDENGHLNVAAGIAQLFPTA